MDTTTRLDEILGRVEKPARYAGGEYNAVRKDPAAVKLRAALVFPDVYEVGMSSLGFQILYHILNLRPDVYCERAFAPWTDMERSMREAGVSLYTLETFTPLSDMDLVGLSFGSESTYTNALTCLDLGGIPAWSRDRAESDPVVLAGGHCAFNPEPMAPFVDAFAVGEGEEVVGEIADCLITSAGQPRRDRIRLLGRIPGVYVPEMLEWEYGEDGTIAGWKASPGCELPVVKRVVRDFENLQYPRAPVVPAVEAVHDRISVEVMRGCTQGCRFCQAGFITRPVRERSPRKIAEIAGELIPATGYDDISLVSLSTADYSGVECTVRQLTEKHGPDGVGVSLPSLRVDAFSVDLAAQIQKVRKTGLTFAPEAGTERLRRAINKIISDEEIFAATDSAWKLGWKRIKLYFMIGLPTETDDDIRGIGRLVREIQRRAWKFGRVKLDVAIGASSFVPKPHTPFQWRAQATPAELEHKVGVLRDATRMPGVKVSWDEPRESQLQGLLSRGDRRVALAIFEAWKAGARFDAWQECQRWDAWESAFGKTGVSPEFYANRRREYDEILPWDHIDAGVKKRYLKLEDQRTLIEQLTPDCRAGKCHGCGVFAGLMPEHAAHGTCYHD